MWHVLKTELIYFRPWLLGALGIGGGAVVLATVINQTVGDIPGHIATSIRGIFFVIAPMIAGFVAQHYRREERRARLLMAGPLTSLQLGWVLVLVPVCLIVAGAVVSGLVMVADVLARRMLEPETGSILALQALHIVGYVGWMAFLSLMMPLLGQEAAAAHRQRRGRAAVAGWGAFVVALLVFAALNTAVFLRQVDLTWTGLHLGNLVIALTVTAASVALYARRTDFTH